MCYIYIYYGLFKLFDKIMEIICRQIIDDKINNNITIYYFHSQVRIIGTDKLLLSLNLFYALALLSKLDLLLSLLLSAKLLNSPLINESWFYFFCFYNVDLLSSAFCSINKKHAKAKNELQNKTVLNDADCFYQMVPMPISKIFWANTMNMIPTICPDVIRKPAICA